METIFKYRHKVKKEDGKKFLYVPLEVPRNVCKIEIDYSYEKNHFYEKENIKIKKEICMLDIGLLDESRNFRGFRGERNKPVYITFSEASFGYVCGDINEGIWNIVIGVAKIEIDEVYIDITVTFNYKEKLLLKGDLHVHTNNSDGDLSVFDTIAIAKKLGLDFLFLTDHNNFVQNEYITPMKDIIVFPGMELTNYNGHCNLLNIEGKIAKVFYNTKEELLEILKEAKKREALITINHPFDKRQWSWGFDIPFDLLEIQNGVFEKEVDDKTIDFWHKLLCKNKKISIVGGSDFHGYRFLHSIGVPTTYVYSEGRSKKDILKAIKNGNSFVSMFKNGPIVSLNVGDAGIGDVTDSKEKLKIKVDMIRKGDIIKIFSDKGLIYKYFVTEGNEFSTNLRQSNSTFYRAEIWRKNGSFAQILASISNPIFINTKVWL